jgi:Uma2 family endonuclease
MATTKALVTAEALAEMPPGDGRRELLDGEVVEMSPAGGKHNEAIAELTYALLAHTKALGLGKVLASDTGIFLRRNPDRVRAPDFCYIAKERVPAEGIPSGYLDIVPDLVVEVVSPSDRATAVQEKVEEWLRAGARLVWMLYPERRTIGVAESPNLVRVLHEDDTLTGEPVLPGFSVAVASLF